ncbi:MAG: ion transporter [Alkalispirochaeta sp.]
MSKTRSVLENVVIVVIVLVLVQTFLEDLALVLGWSVSARQILLVGGFFFDLFFTVEFIVRSYDAWRYRRLGEYFWYDRGWIDFLASIPLLLLNSAPGVLALLVGGVPLVGVGGMLNVLKVVKAIRIARVLRLLRVLKIFRKIKNTDSTMAQRHVAMISATTVSVFVLMLLVLSGLSGTFGAATVEQEYQEGLLRAVAHLEESPSNVETVAATHPGILAIERDDTVVYSRHDQRYFDRYYTAGDYAFLQAGEIALFADLLPIGRTQAQDNLQYFVIIVAIVLVYLFVYSPHFAITVTDPIHVMRRGMAEKTYTLEVKIPPRYRDDDIYRLAAEYNRVYLPMKDRENAADEGSTGRSALSVRDLGDLFD